MRQDAMRGVLRRAGSERIKTLCALAHNNTAHQGQGAQCCRQQTENKTLIDTAAKTQPEAT